jgi:peptide chain release factor 2
MVILDELMVELENYRKDIADLYNILGIDAAKSRIAELETLSSKDGFWNDTENSSAVMKEIKQNENKVTAQKKLSDKLEDTITMLEMIAEENPDDENSDEIIEIKNDARKIKKEIDAVKLSTLLTGEYDSNNAIITFHAGAGGTEAQDWAQMLFRMYNMWAEAHGYKVTTLDYLDGEEAGLKTASILVEGLNAYGFLKSENGVHRLVRI